MPGHVGQIGFVGLGNIGLPMARNVVEGGFPLLVYDTRPEPVTDLVSHGASAAGSIAELAAGSEIVEVCVRDDQQVRDVLLGSGGVVTAAEPGTIVAIHSTIRPRTVEELARASAAAGVVVIDVPITGGAAGAAGRTLCYMAGGDDRAIESCRAVFETSASRIVKTGALGSGAATKLCNNLLMYAGFLAASEAVALAEGAGVARDVLLEVTTANGVMTLPMQAYLGLRDRVAGHGDDAGLRASVAAFAELAEKDLDIALESARDLGIDLPGAERCRSLIRRVYGDG